MDQFYDLTTPQQNIWNLQSFYSDMPIANIFWWEMRGMRL